MKLLYSHHQFIPWVTRGHKKPGTVWPCYRTVLSEKFLHFRCKHNTFLLILQLFWKILTKITLHCWFFTIFALSIRRDWWHWGERLSFDPLENLQNSSVRAKSLKAASPAVAFILLTPSMESAHIYTCRCELIFILTCTGIAEPSD